MEAEEWRQISLAALVEAAQVEGEDPGQHQKDDDEYIGERGGEVAAQLTLEDNRQLGHSDSPRVRLRNTSSNRPRSTSSSLTTQPC